MTLRSSYLSGVPVIAGALQSNLRIAHIEKPNGVFGSMSKTQPYNVDIYISGIYSFHHETAGGRHRMINAFNATNNEQAADLSAFALGSIRISLLTVVLLSEPNG